MCCLFGCNVIFYGGKEEGRVPDGMRTSTITSMASMLPPLTPWRRGIGYTVVLTF